MNSVVSAIILTGALVYGQTQSVNEYAKQIKEDVYNIVPVYVHEINWNDNSTKLNELHSSDYEDKKLTYIKEHKDIYKHFQELISKNKDKFNFLKNNNNDSNITDSADNLSNGSGNNADNNSLNKNNKNNSLNEDKYKNGDKDNKNEFSKYISLQDMLFLDDLYINKLGYKKYTLLFPVEKYKPYKDSYKEFLSNIIKVYKDYEGISIYGYASPDGQKPEMQESLARKRMIKASKSFSKNKEIDKITKYYVCDTSIARELCWKADIYYKPKEKK